MSNAQPTATQDKWQRSADCVSQPVEDSLVILDIQSGEYVALNETAAAIWEQLEQPASQEDIVASLTQAYEVSEDDCAAAVGRTLAMLSDKGLIRTA